MVNYTIKRKVWCTFQFESWHIWPNAPEPYVYLSNSHRHMFHVKVEVSVNHAERDIEFIDLKSKVSGEAKRVLVGSIHDPVPYSCETMAEKLIEFTFNEFSAKDVIVTVSEDGENGATVSQFTTTAK